MRSHRRAGFTLVEAVVVLAVIVIVLAVTIPRVREYNRSRLQARASASPQEVFEFRAWLETSPVPRDEPPEVLLEVRNPTPYDLTFVQRHVGLEYQVGRWNSDLVGEWRQSRGFTPRVSFSRASDPAPSDFYPLATPGIMIPSNNAVTLRLEFLDNDFLNPPDVPHSLSSLDVMLNVGAGYEGPVQLPITIPLAPVDAPEPTSVAHAP